MNLTAVTNLQPGAAPAVQQLTSAEVGGVSEVADHTGMH